jgi:ArsR family transcriptional regulator, cadmium/lead-responsive transcriptional repressor
MAPPLASAEPAPLARFFRVLGDPTRVRLIRALQDGERSVGELVAEVGLRQPRVSAHLACLRHCGFVEYRRQGREVIYRLSLGNLRALIDDASEIMMPLSERLATCTRIGPDWV